MVKKLMLHQIQPLQSDYTDGQSILLMAFPYETNIYFPTIDDLAQGSMRAVFARVPWPTETAPPFLMDKKLTITCHDEPGRLAMLDAAALRLTAAEQLGIITSSVHSEALSVLRSSYEMGIEYPKSCVSRLPDVLSNGEVREYTNHGFSAARSDHAVIVHLPQGWSITPKIIEENVNLALSSKRLYRQGEVRVHATDDRYTINIESNQSRFLLEATRAALLTLPELARDERVAVEQGLGF